MQLRQLMPAVLACGVALIALWALAPAGQPDAAPRARAGHDTSPTGHLDSHTAPPDLAAAEAVARDYAAGLLAGEFDAIEGLAAEGYAQRLFGTQARREPRAGGEPVVEAVIARDLRPDRVTLQALVRDRAGPHKGLEAVTVTLQRAHGSWQVIDGAW
ncbi:MAG: hypothetical protein ACLFRD_11860 [Nitriliruptoraceae bacterium]